MTSADPHRGVLAWARCGLAALLAAGCALGLTVGSAMADQMPITLQYSCRLPVVARTSLTAKFAWPSGLLTTTADTRTPSLPVEVAGTVGSAARTVVTFAGIKWIEGTADVRAEIIAPQGEISEKMKLIVPRTDVSTGSGPLTVPASGPIPSVLLSQPGQAKVVVRSVVIHLATLTASGALSELGNISLPCTLDAGQTGVVSSLRILPVTSPSARSSSAAQPSPRLPTPAHTTPAPTPTPAPTHASSHTPAPISSPSQPSALAKLLPFARSFPGFLLLALFILCAAVLGILKAAGVAVGGLRGVSDRGGPPNRARRRRSAEDLRPSHRAAGRAGPAHRRRQ